MSRSIRGWAVLCALCGSFVTSTALADERTEARRHFRRGMELVVEGRIDEGVAELEEAYNILPHPNVLYNIGRAFAEAGRYEDAIEYFDRYLASGPPDAVEVRGFVAALQERIAARATATAASAAGGAGGAGGAATTTGTTTTTTTTSTSTGDGTSAAGTGAGTDAGATAGAGVSGTQADADALRETAGRLEALAAVLSSPDLTARAERLRTLATAIETQLRADAAAATSTDTTGDGTGTTGTQVGDGTGGATDSGDGTGTQTGDGAGTTGADGIELGADQTDLYEERFVSSTRSAVDPLDAPNSTTIITRQDIRLTGITHIGELLRRVAGVQVMTTGPVETNVGMRGFNTRMANRVLLLVNGRSAYIDPLGIILWQQTQASVEDIERIEVVRGPASALYGANGFSGIVNIITREPGAEPGTEISVGVGSSGQVRGYLGTSGIAGRDGRLGYRFSAAYDRSNRFSYPLDPARADAHLPEGSDPEIAGQGARFFGNLRYRINPETQLYAEGGSTYMRQTTIAATGVFTDIYPIGSYSYAMAGLSSGWGGIRFFWNNFDIVGDQLGTAPFAIDTQWNTYDIEGTFSHGFDTGPVHHDLVAGVGYRRKAMSWNIFASDHQEDHFQGFLQDSVQLTSRLTLVAGIRMDKHPLLEKPVFSPRAALVGRIGERQALRASFSTAFRTMTLLESYLYTFQPTPISAVTAIGAGSYERSRRYGVSPLSPERIMSAELGYQNAESDIFTVDAAVYFNRVQDSIGLSVDTRPFTLRDSIDPALGEVGGFNRATNRFVYGEAGFDNDGATTLVGGLELVGRVNPLDGLDIWANYSLNIAYADAGAGYERVDRAPLHQFNTGVQYRDNLSDAVGVDLAVDFHYQAKTSFDEQVVGATALEVRNFPLAALYQVNARLGLRALDDRLSVGVVGYNLSGLWNPGVRQHPLTQQLDARVMGTAAYRF